jgi:hypothetical protein
LSQAAFSAKPRQAGCAARWLWLRGCAPRRAHRGLPRPLCRTQQSAAATATRDGKPCSRHYVTAYLNKAATAAGIGHVHPHQMRHTLATQAITASPPPPLPAPTGTNHDQLDQDHPHIDRDVRPGKPRSACWLVNLSPWTPATSATYRPRLLAGIAELRLPGTV